MELHRAVVACSHQTVRIGVAPVDRVDLGRLDRFWDTKMRPRYPGEMGGEVGERSRVVPGVPQLHIAIMSTAPKNAQLCLLFAAKYNAVTLSDVEHLAR